MLEGNQAPERIFGVSNSQFSVARYYGGCKAFGHSYHYDANTDSLVRLDVWQDQIGKADKLAKEYAKKERDKWMASQDQLAI